MDSGKLTELLTESWEALCNRRDAETRDIAKRIERMQNNPKAKKIDPAGDKMRQMEAEKQRILEEKTKNKLALYRIRVLNSLYRQEGNK